MSTSEKYPIGIFAYQRFDLLANLLENIRTCDELGGRQIYIFQDGLKELASIDDISLHKKTWEVIQNFQKPQWNIFRSEMNKGLAKSVFEGVSKVLQEHPAGIFLEDDLILSKDFLTFMDEAITTYRTRKDIYSISGFSHLHQSEINEPGVFLFPRPGSWGWATWADRWNGFRLNAISTEVMKEKKLLRQFDRGGEDMSWMLRNSLKGYVNSWAIQWAWYQYIQNAYSIYPECSKTVNTGFREDATHTKAKWFGRMHNPELTPCTSPIRINSEIQVSLERISSYRKFYSLGFLARIKKFLWFLGI